jgi:hypothetical protein
MRQLKYIKLFEAFDSIQIAKTLNFVKKSDKSKFMNALESITKSIDAPLSALNDKNFQYLPYKKAIGIKAASDKVKCSACEGEGKINKAWGSTTRRTKCTTCDGGGAVDPKPKLKYFKFWFNSDGSFIGTTAIDGLYHISKSDVKNFDKKDITEDIRTLSVQELKRKYKLVNGETTMYVENVATRHSGTNRKSCLGKAFIDRDGDFYVVNSSVDTHSMPTGRKYRDYGNYAVDVMRSAQDGRNDADSSFRIYLTSETELKEDIFWNVPVSFYGDGWNTKDSMSKDFLKEAHFAIVFDYDSFAYNGTDWNPVSITKGDRSDARKGATALMSNDDIKSANIDRYVKTLANVDLGEGLTRLVNKIPKIFGGDFALYYIYSEENFSKFKNMLNDVYSFMGAEDDETRSYYNNKIRDRVLDTFSGCDELNSKIAKRLELAKADIAERDALVDVIKVINKLEEVSKRINQKLLKGKIETVEDMEIMLMKAEGIRAALKSDRFEIDYYIKNYLDYLPYTGWRGDSAALDSIKNLSINDIPKNLRKLDQLMSLIDRL